MTIPGDPPLQPLRIPALWRVDHNDFREVDPDTPETVLAYLHGDLFQAVCPARDVLVDLGWYPDGDPNGCFALVVHRTDFYGPRLHEEEAATRQGAVAMLEGALWRFHLPTAASSRP